MGTSSSSSSEVPTRPIAAGPRSGSGGDPTTIELGVPPLRSLAAALTPGARIGRYEVIADAGSGGMGLVLRARDPGLGRDVALKLMRSESAAARARLVREAQAMARLSDANVLPVYDVGEHHGMVFIAMEYVEGRTLAQWLRTRPRSRAEILACFIAAGRGLMAAHSAGIVHRDFKPANVLVGDDARVRVMDFGLARAAEDSEALQHSDDSISGSHTSSEMLAEPLTEVGTVMGTPPYMAPEQHHGVAADARSDQYGFCVALYEALLGVRPFVADNAAALIRNKERGPSFPARVQLPRALRAALARGLDPDPARRFSSMSNLLAALARPAPSRRGWIVATTAVAVIAAITAAAASDDNALCRGADEALAGLWNDTESDAIAAAIVATDLPYARDTAERVRRDIDRWTADWANAYTDACEATAVHGEQSPAIMDARMRCLDGAKKQLGAVVDVLAESDAASVVHATQIVAGLPRIDRCNGAEVLAREVAPPDPTILRDVEALRERLAHAHALELAGRYEDGLAVGGPLLQQAEALGYPPLVAEVAFRKGWIEERSGNFAAAESSLQSAFFSASEAGMDELAAEASASLAVVVGVDLARLDDGLPWAERARVGLEGVEDGTTEAAVCSNLGHFQFARADYDDALALQHCALARKEEMLGPDAPDVATTLHNIGSVLAARGDYDGALAHHARALAIVRQAFGDDHPTVGESENSLGGVHYMRGAYDDAASHFGRALAIWDASLGDDHPDIATVLGNLGAAENERGEVARSIEYQERALAIRERVLGADHPDVGTSLNNLAAAFRSEGSFDRARGALTRALEIWEKALGPDHPDVAITHGNIAKIELLREKPDLALDHARRALAINEAALGPEHPDLGHSLTTIGQSLVALHRATEAIAPLERALAVRTPDRVDAVRIAETRFALARALADAGRDRARARELATEALASYRGAGDRTAPQAREVDAWLAN